MRTVFTPFLAGAALALWTLPAVAQSSEGAQASPGARLVTAGDCRGCHGADLSGGQPVPSPIGAITASNITPDARTGIGDWTLEQFTDVLRKGKSPDRHLYPSMPYTSYTGLTDEQIQQIWDYLQNDVAAVSKEVPDTDLPFPFKRWVMPVWNLGHLTVGQSVGAVPVEGDTLARGQLLVETLGHCSACHTPRGPLMGQIDARHLGGAVVNGWYAPDITPSPGGIGDWADAQLTTFLKKGHVQTENEIAIAGGDMGLVVERSLSQLDDADIQAMVAYLRAVPPQSTTQPLSAGTTDPTLPIAELEQPQTAADALLGHAGTDGARLYQSACASCHGATGQGSEMTGGFPSLALVDATRDPDGLNLVQVISNGIDRKVGDNHAFMPPFGDAMTDAQIAATAAYVRETFGGQSGAITADTVRSIRAGTIGVPAVIELARPLAIGAIVLALALAALALFGLVRARRRQ